MQLHNSGNVKAAFASYLSQPEWKWNWVVHQTFDEHKVDLYPSILGYSWREFMREVARNAAMNYGWCFAETGKLGRLHWHALVHVREDLFGKPRRTDIWAHMFRKFGRNRIEPYKSQLRELSWISTREISDGIARYVAKYIAKETCLDNAWWDFEGFLGGCWADTSRIAAAIGLPNSVRPQTEGRLCRH